eukprot:TRINITY_DN22159_c0_g2_i2.p1 TRINITY_DN22159_c0_g2~~TRINITY_DN22159_c0_g2_i2.p1  ORF type:complete len:633 (-),score=31.49 TRINITY_DN22159_c0_g2_i2:786-2684(-)
MGTELALAFAPNILPCFMRWLAGEALHCMANQVCSSSRLMPAAVRIAGWGHIFGNLMKSAAHRISNWPDILFNVRQLCSFWRNESWRRVVRDKVLACYEVDISKDLKTFQARLAKWRYERLHVCFTSLLSLRHICETYGHRFPSWFSNSSEASLISNVVRACASSELWIFIDVFTKRVLDVLEHGRRWGFICACCNHLRAARKKVSCSRLSRRLAEAPAFINKLRGDLVNNVLSLTLRDCGSVEWILTEVSYSIRAVEKDVGEKCAWVYLVPWRMATADTPAGADSWAQQLRAARDDTLDPISLKHKHTLLPCLDCVASGGEMSLALAAEVRAFQNSPLDEGPGESFHRLTNLTKTRSAASKRPWLLASTREKQNIALCNKYIREYGQQGRLVFKFEWRNWKRILQGRWARRFISRRVDTQKFLAQVYRLDSQGEDDWSSVIQGSSKRPSAKSDLNASLQYDYVKHVLRDRAFYSVQIVRADDSGAADPAAENVQTSYIQILDIATPQKRPKLVPTHETRLAEETPSPLCLWIQHLETWRKRGDDALTVYFDSDPMLVDARFGAISPDPSEFSFVGSLSIRHGRVFRLVKPAASSPKRAVDRFILSSSSHFRGHTRRRLGAALSNDYACRYC